MPMKKNVRLEAANGTPITQYGNWKIPLQVKDTKQRCEMEFLATDVTKPLAAVSAIVEAGNTVVFTKRASFIRNDITGEKINLQCDKGTYTMEVGVEQLTVNAVDAEGDDEMVFSRLV